MFGMNEVVGKKYFRDAEPETLLVTSRFYTLQGEGPFRGFPAYFIRLAKCNLACSFCFVGNTWVSMADGPRRKIKDVQINDSVIAYDEKTRKFQPGRVAKRYESEVNELVCVRTTESKTRGNPTDRIYCTPEHPFLVRGKGWVNAEDLQPNDVLLHLSSSDTMQLRNPRDDDNVNAVLKEKANTIERRLESSEDLFAKHGYETLFVPMPPSGVRNGMYDKIREQVADFIHNGEMVCSIERIKRGSGAAWTRLAGRKNAPCKVYNLEVEGFHTYVANGKIVHNCDTYFDSGDVQKFDQIFAEADQEIARFYKEREMDVPSWAQGKNKRIVLVMTGGEPTLQHNLTPFLEEANKQFFHTQIESNGTQGCELPDKTTLVVSPKCLEKGTKAVRYLTPKKAMLERADCLKFVLCAPELDQFSPYSEVPDWAHEWAEETGKQIFVSPMNMYKKEPQKAKELRAASQEVTIDQRSTVDEVISFWEPDLLDMEKNQRNHEYSAEYAMKHGFILNLQTHLFASLP